MTVLDTLTDIVGAAVLMYLAGTVLAVTVLAAAIAIYHANTAVREALERRYLGIEDDAFDDVSNIRGLQYTRTAYRHAVADGRWWGYVLYVANQIERICREHQVIGGLVDFAMPVLWPIELLGRRVSDNY